MTDDTGVSPRANVPIHEFDVTGRVTYATVCQACTNPVGRATLARRFGEYTILDPQFSGVAQKKRGKNGGEEDRKDLALPRCTRTRDLVEWRRSVNGAKSQSVGTREERGDAFVLKAEGD